MCIRDRNAIAALRGGEAHTPPSAVWARLRQQLKGSTDVERITARIALRQVRPRELIGLQQTLQKTQLLAPVLRGLEAYLTHISGHLLAPEGCAGLLMQAIDPEPAACLLYTSDAADDLTRVDLGGRRAGTAQLCLLYTSPSPRDRTRSRMPSSA